MTKQKILIVGGVAGGASCAARLRRLSETAEIIMFERGSFVSFANCGLPYYIGDVITDEHKLLMATPQLFQERFNVEVRLETEAIAIDRQGCLLTLNNLKTGEVYQEDYTTLVLAPGAKPIRPPLKGIDLPGIFAVRNIPDSRMIRTWIEDHQVKRAVIVGGGFIGLEMAENLHDKGIQITLIEAQTQVMAQIDPEMAQPVHQVLKQKGVNLQLGDGVAEFNQREDHLQVKTRSGATFDTDLVILGIGVTPENILAKEAGLELGQKNGIRVNDQLQTSDPKIWAVGDVIEVKNYLSQEWEHITLANPANREGRVTADAICGRPTKFRGVQATSVCGAFGLVIATTGLNEKTVKKLGWNYDKVYLHPGHHASYYPNAQPINLKLIYTVPEGKILGVQGIGTEGVEKRIDVVAMAIQGNLTVFDLEEAELCYAPQFGSAKDPINLAGMIAANSLKGDAPLKHWQDLDSFNGLLLDVREIHEFSAGHVPNAINIPLPQLRDRLGELNQDQDIFVYCQVGQRGYYATRLLRLNGFKAVNISGGFKTYQALS